MAVTIGLDFGTRSTEIYVKEKGIVLREPTVAAVDAAGNVIAVGTEAILIRGRAPGSVTLRRPINDNSITDFNLAAEMLDRFLETAAPKAHKHVFAAAKYGLGAGSRELLIRAIKECRTGRVELVESALASLAGSGFGMQAEGETPSSGTILCDIGAGSIEASYIRGGELMRSDTCFGGGEAADKLIISHVRRTYGLIITSITARDLKHRFDMTAEEDACIPVSGLDGSTGLPKRIQIGSEELLDPLSPQLDGAAEAIRTAFNNLPRIAETEASVDRIILVGGGAVMPGAAQYIADEIEREVLIPANPLDCTVTGLGMMLEKFR